nr:MAG TPA: CI repressor [Caudoviricetes sp.]
MLDVRLIIEQLKTGLNSKTDKDLCEKIGVPKQTLSGWKSRNSIPLEMIFDISQKFSLDLNWLITGKEKAHELKATEKMLLTAFNELDDKQQLQAVVFVGNLAQGGGASGQSGSIMTVNNSQADNIANGSITIGR